MRGRILTVGLVAVAAVAFPGIDAATATAQRSATRPSAARQVPPNQDALFSPTTVWTAHLRFTPEQWAAIRPVQGAGRGSYSSTDWLQGQEGHRNGWGVVNGVEFEYVHADLDIAGRTFRDVAVRYKGNGTYLSGRSSGKVSFKVDLNKYVKGQKLLGLSTLNFHNMIVDPGFMNEALAYRLYRDAGVPASRTAYVKVSVTVGTQPARDHGLFLLVENVDTNFIQARLKLGDGAILKPSTRDPFVDRGAAWSKYNQTYDPKTDLTDAEKQRIIEFCQFVSRATDRDFVARIGNYVDVEAFARYMAVLVWLSNPDSILERGQNYYVYLHPQTGRLHFMPWDQDHSFGTFHRTSLAPYETSNIHVPWVRGVRFLERMNTVPAYRTAYLARMREFSSTLFAPARFSAQVAELAPVTRSGLQNEPARIPAFERHASGQAGILRFAPARTKSVIDQLGRAGR
jgi:hypothetical protein